MTMFKRFDVSMLRLRSTGERGHDLRVSDCIDLGKPLRMWNGESLVRISEAIGHARRRDKPVVAFIGAHPIKLGLSRFLIDLMERRFITHLATNGAGVIHDYELATLGGTSENVPHWIAKGQFGLWQESSQLNEVIKQGTQQGLGIGESVGRHIVEEAPTPAISLAASAYRNGVALTSHVTIGGDIVHSCPNCDGAAWGEASYTDFLIFAEAIRHMEGGVFLNIGTAVTGPEIYLKALSMARNVEHQSGRAITRFTTGVFDLAPIPANWRTGPPEKSQPGYYFRPWKTILCRTVADGGQSYYVQGDHQTTIPSLWWRLTEGEP